MSESTVKNEELFNFLMSEANKPFSGWDFSYITGTGRVASSPLIWNYTSKILMKIRKIKLLLDMGTGGGEFLSLLQPLPRYTYATEGYKPNVLVARNKLEPIGVKVVEVGNDGELPFDNNYFDLIINKHESYSCKEIYRILKPKSQFVTQQVGGLDNVDLNKMLDSNEDFGMKYWDLKYAVKELEDSGMNLIEQKEDFPVTRFYDVGAIVYYLKAIPWQIPDFNIEKYFDSLIRIHNKILSDGFVDVKSHRFFIVAEKLN